MVPTSINGFTVIPVSYSSSSIHYLYGRSHSETQKEFANSLPSGRTLFLANVPPDATERAFIQLFRSCGTVERVIFDSGIPEVDKESDGEEDEAEVEDEEMSVNNGYDEQSSKRRRPAQVKPPRMIPLPLKQIQGLRKSARSAYIVFLDSSSLDRTLTLPHKIRPWPLSEEDPSGLLYYKTLYSTLRPPLDAVRTHADSWIDVYEYELSTTKQKSKYRKGEAIVDEDGFTLVTRGGAYGQTLGGGVAVASKRFQKTGQSTRTRTKKESKEKESFYGFQKAEKQRNGAKIYALLFVLGVHMMTELINLKRKWEEDKAKVEKLKASRRFKPY